ncbi:hypothetical protein O181_023578 [Austropuccinia psidii MF-1]|uniref:Reverse transcriptase domain-containing protein n=1 Tax=Austropuccinia psidii MF-1 TaxID=1389203 RepID=A0A9Q3GXE7_9BASI|nr:hypothetical protein [Austropuccinia psidii MF-1]
MFLVPTFAALDDIQTSLPTPDCSYFLPIMGHEVSSAISKLPNKKVAGLDNTPNELLKIAKDTITPHLSIIFNECLKTHHFPPQWKEALTTIIRKAGKEDYMDPNTYQSIALLNTQVKLFEKIINDRLTYWAERSNTPHPGHVGGRLGKSINDAFTMLSTWIHQKWREKKILLGLFLAVKSAYPTVYKERIIHSLRQKNCPTYLYLIIKSFLTKKTTHLFLDQYISQEFPIPNGLPQGSPLSVTLYLLYNSDLLLPTRPSLDNDSISIAYINDLTHLVVEPTLKSDSFHQKEDRSTLDPIEESTPGVQEEGKVARNNPHTQRAPQKLKQTLQQHTRTAHQNNTLNFWTEPKRIKATNIRSFTYMNPTWQHHVVHNEEQKRSQQASRHVAPQSCLPKHRNDETNAHFFHQTLW